MKFTAEQITKAKAAKNAEELLALAKENGIELTEDEAKKYFEQGELADEELENVSGAGCGDTPDELNTGDRVRVTSGDWKGKTGTVQGMDYQSQDWADYVWVLFDGESKKVSMPVDRLEHI